MKARYLPRLILAALLGAGAIQAQASDNAVPARALIVAVSEFSDPELAPYALQGAAQDAVRMEEAFTSFAGTQAQATILLGENATLGQLRRELAQLIDLAAPGERIMLYFSAHGSRIPDSGPRDEADGEDEVLLLADAGEWNGSSLPGALVDDELAQAVRAMRLKGADVFLVIDSCASGGAMRTASRHQLRMLPPALLGTPERRMRSVSRRDASWVEGDLPAGSGRLVTLAASPTYEAAWDTPEGGLFTASLAAALASGPDDFVSLAREQQRQRVLSSLPGPASQLGGMLESSFFFTGAPPDLLASASALQAPQWTMRLHAAPQPDCDPERIGPPREVIAQEPLRLDHCDAVMVSLLAARPGFVDAWYIDSAGQRTLLTPVAGLYLDGRSAANLSFTFVKRDPQTGKAYPAGADHLILLRRSGNGVADSAQVITLAVDG